jgi:general secretion pathway protein A
MYESFFGLRERPFDLTPNPRFLVLTPRHREALSNLQYGIAGRKGITLLLGEVGTGKTTVVRAAMDAARRQSVRVVYLSNPTLTRDELVEVLAHGFGLSEAARRSKGQFLLEIEPLLLRRHAEGVLTVLIVDEAQKLTDELLEEVRLLANFETNEEKLLPVVLVGQPELADRLNHPSLRQLKQRVALRCDLAPLTPAETAVYISQRVARSGGDATTLFTREAVASIHDRSGGVPRTVSVICDNALVNAFASGRSAVTRGVVEEVCRDFDFREAAPAATGTGNARILAIGRSEPMARGVPAGTRTSAHGSSASGERDSSAWYWLRRRLSWL